jgi:hypothetical protein
VERLVVVDISPAQTTTRTNFHSYIQAMKDVNISSDIPRSTARRMAEDQLRKLVKVRASSSLAITTVITTRVHTTVITTRVHTTVITTRVHTTVITTRVHTTVINIRAVFEYPYCILHT